MAAAMIALGETKSRLPKGPGAASQDATPRREPTKLNSIWLIAWPAIFLCSQTRYFMSLSPLCWSWFWFGLGGIRCRTFCMSAAAKTVMPPSYAWASRWPNGVEANSCYCGRAGH